VITPTSARAPTDGLVDGTGAVQGLAEVLLELFIGEFSCLYTTFDQVIP
jgi:hypothetical protein